MQIVIDIPEKLFNIAKDGMLNDIQSMFICGSVSQGTPLPKGHGDLKDVDNLKHAFVMWSMAVQGNFSDADIASIICNSPTIIEADKEMEG